MTFFDQKKIEEKVLWMRLVTLAGLLLAAPAAGAARNGTALNGTGPMGTCGADSTSRLVFRSCLHAAPSFSLSLY